jgi:hypothetical protein
VTDDAVALAFFRHKAKPRTDTGARAGAGGLAVHVNRACIGRVHACQKPHQLGSARSDQTGNSQHLTRVQIKAGIHHGRTARQRLHPHQHLVGGKAAMAGMGQFAAHHGFDDLGNGGLRDGNLGNQATIAQDRRLLAQPEHLVHLVTDIDDGHALRGQGLDHLNQTFKFLGGQRGCRFIHRNDLCIGAQGLGNLDNLALRHAQGTDRGGHVDGGIKGGQQTAGLGLLRGTVNDKATGTAQGRAKIDILGNRQFGNLLQFLMDHRDPCRRRIAGAGDLHRRAINLDRAAIAGDHARQDVQHRRFACAVLAQQPMHLTGQDRQRHAMQDLQRAIGFGDA